MVQNCLLNALGSWLMAHGSWLTSGQRPSPALGQHTESNECSFVCDSHWFRLAFCVFTQVFIARIIFALPFWQSFESTTWLAGLLTCWLVGCLLLAACRMPHAKDTNLSWALCNAADCPTGWTISWICAICHPSCCLGGRSRHHVGCSQCVRGRGRWTVFIDNACQPALILRLVCQLLMPVVAVLRVICGSCCRCCCCCYCCCWNAICSNFWKHS